METLRQYCLAALTEKSTGTSAKGYLRWGEFLSRWKLRTVAYIGSPRISALLGSQAAGLLVVLAYDTVLCTRS